MKKLIPLLFLVFSLTANATTYYISANGNDANNGTSTSTSWKTLNKLNSFFSSLKSGDNVLLNRGDVFYGSITINKSGSSGSPISIGAYGSGADPVVSGFTAVTSWTNLGGNIWESTNSVTSLSACNIVVINGVNTAMGRYPNSGFLTYQSHSGTNSITSSGLTGSPNWTGAEAVIRTIRWTLERDKITSQSGGTLVYSGSTQTPTNTFGFFIQNDTRTLDVQNEWYFNPSTRKIRVYSSGTPSNVKVSSIDRLSYTNGFNYITFDNIDFEGANTTALENRNSKYITVQNCSFVFSGRYGIYINNATSVNEIMTINNNVFSNIIENAMSFLGYSTNVWIKNNTITNTGMIPGGGTNNQNSCDAIDISGRNSIIEYNTITNTGHTAIAMRTSDGMIARYNYISYFGMTKYDAGGIYSWNSAATVKSRIIDHNLVIYSKQTSDGIGTAAPSLFGIYLDGSSNNTFITNNTVAHCKNGDGIHILNTGSCTITNNVSYDNGNQLAFLHAFGGGMAITGTIVKHNIFFSKNYGQLTFYFRDDDDLHFNKFGTADSNFYTRPIDDNLITQSVIVYTSTNKSFSQWQSFTGQDAHSKKAPKSISDTSDLAFVYNETSSSKTIPLSFNYIDVNNLSYNGTITLAPYTSAVLMKNGATSNLLPAVNPANTVNGLNYKYYEATNYTVLPNFSSLTAVKTGTTTNFNISLANRSDNFAFNFTGYVTVPTDGQYTFYTNSDDGSKLYIDNVLVVTNDGVHPARENSGTIGLKAGKHAITVGFFEQQGGQVLDVSYSGPGVSKKAIPSSALYRVSGSGLVGLDLNNVAISAATETSIKAYPNPFANYIEVNIHGAAGEYKLMLVDISGKIIWTKTGVKNAGAFQESINTSALQRGVYFLKVIQSNNSAVIKLVK